MKNKYSKELFEKIQSYLDSVGQEYNIEEEYGILHFPYEMHELIDFNFAVVIIVEEIHYQVRYYFQNDIDVENPNIFKNMTDFVNRANFGLNLGYFNFDCDKGELCYQYSVDCDDMNVSKEIIQNSIEIPKYTIEQYLPGVLRVIFVNMDSKKAIQYCEE